MQPQELCRYPGEFKPEQNTSHPENIPSLPGASVRANKIVAFDNSGNPMVTLPPSGSASDVLIELAKPTGADHSGIAQGGTVQNALTSIYLDGFPGDNR
jgi:hypothetical protein